MPFPLTDLDQIIAICDRFEADWRAGRPHRIEGYLDKVPETLRDRLFGELRALDLELRQADNQRSGSLRGSVIEPESVERGCNETPVWEARRPTGPSLPSGHQFSATTSAQRGAEGGGTGARRYALVLGRQDGWAN